MKRRFCWLGIVTGAAFFAATAAWVSLRGSMGASTSAPPGAVETQRQEVRKADVPTADAPKESARREKLPKAVTDETVHDCGTLDPGESCEHRFVLRNEGEAPLSLERGGTSCKCTISELPKNEIPPGGAIEVRVASKIEPEEGPFLHRATILTNDPDRPHIDFSLKGQVRTVLTVSRPSIQTYSLANERPPGEDVLIYSLAWEEFTITDVRASAPEATWQVRPAEQVLLDRYQALCGYVLTVEMPAEEKGGRYPVKIDVTASPAGRPEIERSVHIEYQHEVRTGASLSGPNLQSYDNTLNLGPLYEGERKTDYLVLDVRDKQPLNVLAIESNPSFLKIALEPLASGRGGTQLYRVRIEVPPEARPCNFRTQSGWVRITTDSPAAKEIEFNVSFAICPRF